MTDPEFKVAAYEANRYLHELFNKDSRVAFVCVLRRINEADEAIGNALALSNGDQNSMLSLLESVQPDNVAEVTQRKITA